MRKFSFVLFILFSLFLLSSCSHSNVSSIHSEESIMIKERIKNTNDYQTHKTIKNDKMIQEIKNVLKDLKWENAKVSMNRPADYRFRLQEKGVTNEVFNEFFLWISPKGNQIELVVEPKGDYIQLNEKDSSVFLQLIAEVN